MSFVEFCQKCPSSVCCQLQKQHLRYDPEEEDSYNFSPSTLGKFHSSKRFLKSATHVFADFPQDVYILPVRGDMSSFARVGAMEGEEAISHLENLSRTSELRYLRESR